DLAVNQLLWLFIGIAAMIATLAVVRNLDKLANYKYTLMIVGILLLLSPMLPVIGYESGGGQLWLRIGGFSFQPGELAKILIVFFIAAYLAANREMLSVFTWKVGPLWLPSLATLLRSSSCGRSPSSSSCWRRTSASPWYCSPCSSSCCMWPRGRSSTSWCPLGLRPLRLWPFTA
ncbi:MAG: FtsW/RodA/SpoVE family cell cycle protein, partial [Adlercreutzia equolifaciens]